MEVIITGTTSIPDKGVMLECLSNANIKDALSVSRAPLHIGNSTLNEDVVLDFQSLKENDETLGRL